MKRIIGILMFSALNVQAANITIDLSSLNARKKQAIIIEALAEIDMSATMMPQWMLKAPTTHYKILYACKNQCRETCAIFQDSVLDNQHKRIAVLAKMTACIMYHTIKESIICMTEDAFENEDMYYKQTVVDENIYTELTQLLEQYGTQKPLQKTGKFHWESSTCDENKTLGATVVSRAGALSLACASLQIPVITDIQFKELYREHIRSRSIEYLHAHRNVREVVFKRYATSYSPDLLAVAQTQLTQSFTEFRNQHLSSGSAEQNKEENATESDNEMYTID